MTPPEKTPIKPQSLPTPLDLPLEWRVSAGHVDYDIAVAEMAARAEAIRQGMEGELVWLLEHAPIYTAGTSAKPEDFINRDLLNTDGATIREVGRGGEWTYHGPGQRIVYIMLDISRRGQDVRRFVREVETWAIASLTLIGVNADRRQGHPGVWLNTDKLPPDKIAAIGVRLTKWVSWHGMAINHSPDLTAYERIVPCGIHDGGVTAITNHRPNISMAELDGALAKTFATSFPFDG